MIPLDITHVLEENDQSVTLTEPQADDLESSGVIRLCEDCSRIAPCLAGSRASAQYVYHTTYEWDLRCEEDSSDPVTRALEQVNG